MTVQNLPWLAFSAELLALYRLTRADKTRRKMRQVLADVGHLGVATTAALTPELVARYLDAVRARGCSPNTAAGLASYLRRACRYAVGRGYLAVSPFACWTFPARPGRAERPTYHPPADVARVLAYLAGRAGNFAGRRLSTLAAVLACTGMRRSEALYLRRADVAADGSTVAITPHRLRPLKRPSCARVLPCCPELAAALVAWLPAVEWSDWLLPGLRGRGPWANASAGYRPADQLRAAGAAVGVSNLSPASLRHSFGTTAALVWGMPPAALQALMGHTSVQTTLRYYAHPDPSNLRGAVAMIRWAG